MIVLSGTVLHANMPLHWSVIPIVGHLTCDSICGTKIITWIHRIHVKLHLVGSKFESFRYGAVRS